MVRGGWVDEHLVAPLMLGSVRPVESVVKPSRRITKARRHGLRNLRALALLLR